MSTNLHHLNCIRHRSRQCLRQPSMQVSSTASTWVINRLQRTVRRSANGHPVPKQCYCMTQRIAVGRSCDPKPERRIIDRFPRSHHRPSIIKVPSLFQPIAGKPVKRWNFRKTNWELFTAETERRTPGLPNPQADDADATYTAYCNMLICAAKKSIPRGFNKHYIPGWDHSCNHLLREHQQATTKEDIDTTATSLLHKKKKLYSTPNRQMYKLQYLTYQIYNLSNYVRTYIDIMCINIHRRYKKNDKY